MEIKEGIKYTYRTKNKIAEIFKSEKPDIEDYSKYEIGCWYKNLGANKKHIGKLTGFVTENNFPSEEYINPKGILCKGVYFLDFKYATKISLEEIQQYLPDNHPDKIIHCWYYDGEAYDPTPIEEINKLQDYYNNNLKNKSTNMTDDFEEQLARQEQALALANLKKAPFIELKDDIGNRAYMLNRYTKQLEKEPTLKWYTDSLKQHTKDNDYLITDVDMPKDFTSVGPERSSTLNQIKKRSKKVTYKSIDIFNDWK